MMNPENISMDLETEDSITNTDTTFFNTLDTITNTDTTFFFNTLDTIPDTEVTFFNTVDTISDTVDNIQNTKDTIKHLRSFQRIMAIMTTTVSTLLILIIHFRQYQGCEAEELKGTRDIKKDEHKNVSPQKAEIMELESTAIKLTKDIKKFLSIAEAKVHRESEIDTEDTSPNEARREDQSPVSGNSPVVKQINDDMTDKVMAIPEGLKKHGEHTALEQRCQAKEVEKNFLLPYPQMQRAVPAPTNQQSALAKADDQVPKNPTLDEKKAKSTEYRSFFPENISMDLETEDTIKNTVTTFFNAMDTITSTDTNFFFNIMDTIPDTEGTFFNIVDAISVAVDNIQNTKDTIKHISTFQRIMAIMTTTVSTLLILIIHFRQYLGSEAEELKGTRDIKKDEHGNVSPQKAEIMELESTAIKLAKDIIKFLSIAETKVNRESETATKDISPDEAEQEDQHPVSGNSPVVKQIYDNMTDNGMAFPEGPKKRGKPTAQGQRSQPKENQKNLFESDAQLQRAILELTNQLHEFVKAVEKFQRNSTILEKKAKSTEHGSFVPETATKDISADEAEQEDQHPVSANSPVVKQNYDNMTDNGMAISEDPKKRGKPTAQGQRSQPKENQKNLFESDAQLQRAILELTNQLHEFVKAVEKILRNSTIAEKKVKSTEDGSFVPETATKNISPDEVGHKDQRPVIGKSPFVNQRYANKRLLHQSFLKRYEGLSDKAMAIPEGPKEHGEHTTLEQRCQTKDAEKNFLLPYPQMQRAVLAPTNQQSELAKADDQVLKNRTLDEMKAKSTEYRSFFPETATKNISPDEVGHKDQRPVIGKSPFVNQRYANKREESRCSDKPQRPENAPDPRSGQQHQGARQRRYSRYAFSRWSPGDTGDTEQLLTQHGSGMQDWDISRLRGGTGVRRRQFSLQVAPDAGSHALDPPLAPSCRIEQRRIQAFSDKTMAIPEGPKKHGEHTVREQRCQTKEVEKNFLESYPQLQRAVPAPTNQQSALAKADDQVPKNPTLDEKKAKSTEYRSFFPGTSIEVTKVAKYFVLNEVTKEELHILLNTDEEWEQFLVNVELTRNKAMGIFEGLKKYRTLKVADKIRQEEEGSKEKCFKSCRQLGRDIQGHIKQFRVLAEKGDQFRKNRNAAENVIYSTGTLALVLSGVALGLSPFTAGLSFGAVGIAGGLTSVTVFTTKITKDEESKYMSSLVAEAKRLETTAIKLEVMIKVFVNTAMNRIKGVCVNGGASTGLEILMGIYRLVQESKSLLEQAKYQSGNRLRQQARELENMLVRIQQFCEMLK